jgi:hypothetical protein
MLGKGYGNRKGVDSQVRGLTGRSVKHALTEVSLFHAYGTLSQEPQELQASQESGEHRKPRSCTFGDCIMSTGRYIKLGVGVRLMPKAPRLCPQESREDDGPPKLEI